MVSLLVLAVDGLPRSGPDVLERGELGLKRFNAGALCGVVLSEVAGGILPTIVARRNVFVKLVSAQDIAHLHSFARSLLG